MQHSQRSIKEFVTQWETRNMICDLCIGSPYIRVVWNHGPLRREEGVMIRVELLQIIYRFTGKLFLPFYRQILGGKNGKMVKNKDFYKIIVKCLLKHSQFCLILLKWPLLLFLIIKGLIIMFGSFFSFFWCVQAEAADHFGTRGKWLHYLNDNIILIHSLPI